MGPFEGTMEGVVMIDPTFWHGRRVLITGHTGFKGSWLLLWLHQMGANIFGYALPPSNGPNLYTQLGQFWTPDESWKNQFSDLSDLESLKTLIRKAQPEVVFHLAAQPL